MPCNGEYLNPVQWEIEGSRVESFLDEIAGLPFDKDHFRGYHPRVYGQPYQKRFNQRVAQLCLLLREVDVTKYSLELQIWWRDHQIADAQREVAKEAERYRNDLINSARSKLTREEMEVLGLK